MEEKREIYLHPLAICRRLIDLVISITWRLKQLRFGHPPPSHGSTEAPLKGSPRTGSEPTNGEMVPQQMPVKHKSVHRKKARSMPFDNKTSKLVGGELAYASEKNIPTLRRAQPRIQKRAKNSTSLSPIDKKDQPQLSLVQEIGVFDGISLSLVEDKSVQSQTKGRDNQDTLTLSKSAVDGARRPKWSIEEKGKRKQEDLETEKVMTTPVAWDEVVKAAPRPRPPLSFTYNINEKSDAFIRTRMEAMRKTL